MQFGVLTKDSSETSEGVVVVGGEQTAVAVLLAADSLALLRSKPFRAGKVGASRDAVGATRTGDSGGGDAGGDGQWFCCQLGSCWRRRCCRCCRCCCCCCCWWWRTKLKASTNVCSAAMESLVAISARASASASSASAANDGKDLIERIYRCELASN